MQVSYKKGKVEHKGDIGMRAEQISIKLLKYLHFSKMWRAKNANNSKIEYY